MGKKKFAVLRRFSQDGTLDSHVEVRYPPRRLGRFKPVMTHEFALTEKYAIFVDPPLFFEPMVREACVCTVSWLTPGESL